MRHHQNDRTGVQHPLTRHRLTRTLSITVGMAIGVAATTLGPQLAHAGPTLKAPSLLQQLMQPAPRTVPAGDARA
jgi:hypothetical protein